MTKADQVEALLKGCKNYDFTDLESVEEILTLEFDDGTKLHIRNTEDGVIDSWQP